jgi:hypothetical protein
MRILRPGDGLDAGGELELGIEGALETATPSTVRIIITKTVRHSVPLVDLRDDEVISQLESCVDSITGTPVEILQGMGLELNADRTCWQRIISSFDNLAEAGTLGAVLGRVGGAGHEEASPLRVFIAHASEDKSRALELYDWLQRKGVEPWLDKKSLIPGQDWKLEIDNAVRSSHVVLVCLSGNSVTKEGYFQKELRRALDVAEEKPEGAVFIVPVRLEPCECPSRLASLHWVDLFGDTGHADLFRALDFRARQQEVAPPQSPSATPPPETSPAGHSHDDPYLVTTNPSDRVREYAVRARVFGVEYLVFASQYVTLDAPRLRRRLLAEAKGHYDAALAAGREKAGSTEWWTARGFARGRYGARWETCVTWDGPS